MFFYFGGGTKKYDIINLEPKYHAYSEETKALALKTYYTGTSGRGVEQILIACHDNLNDFGSAINTVFPKTRQQLCIIHQIRNSTKHVSYKDLKPVMVDLKLTYNANNVENEEYQLEVFSDKWNGKHPQIDKSWRTNWLDLIEYFQYPQELRTLIYTTNAVEGFHRMLRKHTKNKTPFPTDDSLRKSIYLSVQEIAKKWNMPIRYWGTIIFII